VLQSCSAEAERRGNKLRERQTAVLLLLLLLRVVSVLLVVANAKSGSKKEDAAPVRCGSVSASSTQDTVALSFRPQAFGPAPK